MYRVFVLTKKFHGFNFNFKLIGGLTHPFHSLRCAATRVTTGSTGLCPGRTNGIGTNTERVGCWSMSIPISDVRGWDKAVLRVRSEGGRETCRFE
ncbi:hypothetical protein TNCT_702691 [Trichonephila clavata]|uniref:Uncharacterized protein n=1 Tax=Trichonephila clavata TaxID=2740835 RepID=A0A8X6HMT7_TRICU|nr:hypothetical protein TNCT_702691 [Trichonephila clavata]